MQTRPNTTLTIRELRLPDRRRNHPHSVSPNKAPYWFFFFPDPKLEKQTPLSMQRGQREKTATMMEDTINSASKQNKRRHSKGERSEKDVRTTQRREEEDDRAA
jgi:hypothetical protein